MILTLGQVEPCCWANALVENASALPNLFPFLSRCNLGVQHFSVLGLEKRENYEREKLLCTLLTTLTFQQECSSSESFSSFLVIFLFLLSSFSFSRGAWLRDK